LYSQYPGYCTDWAIQSNAMILFLIVMNDYKLTVWSKADCQKFINVH